MYINHIDYIFMNRYVREAIVYRNIRVFGRDKLSLEVI